MDYTAMLQAASQATADTVPQTLQALFPAMSAAALLDTEVEMILQALRTAARVSIRALRADWQKFLVTHPAPGGATASSGAGTPVLFTDPDPWPATVDGGALLDELCTFYRRYVVLQEGAAEMLALWTLHTYTHTAAQVTPRVGIESPQKRCGKTTLLALMGAVVARPLPASNITPAALFRAIEQWQPTMLIDEADTFLPDNDELRGVLNAGHSRSQAYVIRTVGEDHEPRAFRVWAPVAIALIGKLPSTLADRAIVVKMRRKLSSEHVERLRLDRLQDAEELRRRCLRWAQDALLALPDVDPRIPEGVHDRAADNWRALCAIAEVAGGQWAHRAGHAIKALTPQEMDDEAAGVLLLEDFHHLFATTQADRLASEAVVAALRKLEERPWSEWGRQEKPITARQVARLLSPFGIKSKTIRVGTETPKGYEQDDFMDAWTRYLPLLSATPPQASNDAGVEAVTSATPPDTRSATPPQMANDADSLAMTSATVAPLLAVADEYGRTAALQADCGGVADRPHNLVEDGIRRNPASYNGCGGVADQIPMEEGETTAPHPHAVETFQASLLWCATCQSPVSFRTLPQLDGTEVYLCDTCNTEVGQKRSTAPPSSHTLHAPDAVPLAPQAASGDDAAYEEIII